jgi:hypothetical protein
MSSTQVSDGHRLKPKDSAEQLRLQAQNGLKVLKDRGLTDGRNASLLTKAERDIHM